MNGSFITLPRLVASHQSNSQDGSVWNHADGIVSAEGVYASTRCLEASEQSWQLCISGSRDAVPYVRGAGRCALGDDDDRCPREPEGWKHRFFRVTKGSKCPGPPKSKYPKQWSLEPLLRDEGQYCGHFGGSWPSCNNGPHNIAEPTTREVHVKTG